MATDPGIENEITERLARLRDTAAVELRGLADEMAARADAERQVALDAAVAERDAAIASALDAAATESAEEMDAAISRALAEAAGSGRRTLLASVRRLDEPLTLSGVLDALAAAAAAEAGTAVLFVAEGGAMRAWRRNPPRRERARAADAVAAAHRDLVDQVVARRRTEARASEGVAAVPLLVGGEVLAVCVAAAVREGTSDDEATDVADPPAWAAGVELLARHAACRLEALTANRAAEVARLS